MAKRLFKNFLFVLLFALSACSLPTVNKKLYHSVAWLNYDNTLLYRDSKVEDGAIPVYKGETPTKPCEEKGFEYKFIGWTPDIVPAYVDASYTATFEKTVAKCDYNDVEGTEPVVDLTNKTVEYGLYPKTYINDSDLLGTLNSIAEPEPIGWYLFNGTFYAKLTSSQKNDAKFDDSTKIVEGEEYWFKCEPISWKILEENNGEYLLLSSLLLDTHIFDYNSNNYKDSDVRAWLNNEFFTRAFCLNDNYIKTTNVDNSASTTDANDNDAVCENTQDKVFMLSYKDYLNENYGFTTIKSTSSTRWCQTTEWARASGAYVASRTGMYNVGYYWTRSPVSKTTTNAYSVGEDGALYPDPIGTGLALSACVRPCITFVM